MSCGGDGSDTDSVGNVVPNLVNLSPLDVVIMSNEVSVEDNFIPFEMPPPPLEFSHPSTEQHSLATGGVVTGAASTTVWPVALLLLVPLLLKLLPIRGGVVVETVVSTWALLGCTRDKANPMLPTSPSAVDVVVTAVVVLPVDGVAVVSGPGISIPEAPR